MSSDQSATKSFAAVEKVEFPRTNVGKGPVKEAKFLRNTWYVAMFSSDLDEGQLMHRTILNEPILFFRKEDGSVAAIIDRCSHRFAPLSMGKLLPGDRVQCIYHGLEFGADGHCVKNPHGNCSIPNAAHLKSFPVVERHTLVWIWMGDKPADPDKIPDYSCLDDRPELHVTRPGYLNVAANYELVVDNLLDLSHINYVHAGILGNADTVAADVVVEQDGDTVTVSRNCQNAESPGILQMMSPEGFERGDQWNSISWYAPSNLILEFGVSKVGEPKEKGTGYYAIHLLTPETDRTTHYNYTAARWNVLTGDEQNRRIRNNIYEMRTFAFADQDVPVIEAQQIVMDQAGDSVKPVLLSVDVGPARYQRVLDRLMKDEGQ
ncbi:MAG: Rieske (2Fe-2S) protein [Sneathiella sp.]|jgi:vanillate O-demethylase monooxygenase subunit|uniref:aromatic ring-hydroxylating dioxygenase subunit alpha n=1 Tax=Sneathiella sp. TaxID=1964365 RepID=UPI000C4F44CA|nr:aromatic ring-hydroxylating dioxygenase subunit alpha [Sneathiella sp.]MAL80769.1 Rieske (2Fe-2S) protein [Sneathiella sp.]|tara:strand:- start:2306 stop:3436 length:1131 start_codon:yes stop_codon:yes gene_type:complete